MVKFFYITTPIFYPNAKLHLGHAYSMTIADIIARYKKSKGYKVYFQTGSDDHGEKIEKKAETLKITPLELVNQNVLLFQKLWQKLGVEYNYFFQTSQRFHYQKVQKIFTQLLNQGDIYLGEYKGNYCVSCEDYISEGKIVHSGRCPFCQSEIYPVAEPAYFLRLSKYRSELLKHYSQNPDFLWPLNRKKELFENFLKNEVRDLCITRQDVKWGIPVPQDERLTIYVWFEALLNYLNSESGEKLFTPSYSEISEEKKISNVKEVSCVTIQNKNGEYLLVYNKKHGKWQIPGGKLESGETPEEAAKREIFEETNLIVKGLKKFGEKVFYVDDIWWKIYFYQTNNYSGELLIKEPNIIREAKFFKVNEIEKINSQVHDVVTEFLLEKLNTSEIIHLIGKEIVRFHAIYWLTILFALNKRLPNKILAHGWLVDSKGRKESKSIGNTTDPLELLKKYPPELLRAYFIAKVNFLQDGICSEELLKEFYQDFLVNNLGNICSRVGKMLELYCNNLVPEFEKSENAKLSEYYQTCFSVVKEYQNLMDNYQLTKAFQEIQRLLDLSNKIIHELEPWNLFKLGSKKLLNNTLNYLTNGIKIIAFLLLPIIPESSKTIFEFLNVNQSSFNWANLLDFSQLNQVKVKNLNQHLYNKL